HDVSFSAKQGEVIGVIGGTGSGKSTLVNLIPRFYDVSEGEVLVNGTPVREWSAERLRERIGVVPQRAVLFRGTIRDNLRWGNENATEEEMYAALRIAQAEDIVRGKEGGLDAPVEQNGRNFSGGQRQRLTIARALVRKPEILILDDSSSALDYATDAALRRALREIPDAPTVFIVSQRATSLQHADRIVVLDDGEVAGIGKHDELLASCETYREIYESQFRKESV
ncbi:MAG: ABC transporter ATP-binding protein, partial [Clostridia bacterium]|nr:ABC transporter ATP-binding protein [Clostridia bacterium]